MRITAPENRAQEFKQRVIQLVHKFDIHEDKYAQKIHAQRIAHLLHEELIILYQAAAIGTDAECYFFEWATTRKLICRKIDIMEYNIKQPYPQHYHRLFTVLTFVKYTDIADSIINPIREPIIAREPVTRLFKI